MKNLLATLAASFLLAVPAWAGTDHAGHSDETHAAMSASLTEGQVRKVDREPGKLTIKHGPLENLGMDAMTMVFKVKDPAMISQVKVGDKIDFVAEEVDGALTVTKLQKK